MSHALREPASDVRLLARGASLAPAVPVQVFDGRADPLRLLAPAPPAGDDHSLLLWDTRRGGAPVLHVAKAHGAQDLHCVAWSPHQQEQLVTGAPGCLLGSIEGSVSPQLFVTSCPPCAMHFVPLPAVCDEPSFPARRLPLPRRGAPAARFVWRDPCSAPRRMPPREVFTL